MSPFELEIHFSNLCLSSLQTLYHVDHESKSQILIREKKNKKLILGIVLKIVSNNYSSSLVLLFEGHVWQGTLIALASFTEGKLVNQLKSAALLCPVAYLSHMKTVLGVVVANSFIGEVNKLINDTNF